MKASETSFTSFMQKTGQFSIPIYQRKYSWTKEQCDRLWNDVVKAGQDESINGHFIGSVVYVHEGAYEHVTVPEMLVIDGQQRLTTLSLFLSALGKVIDDEKIDTKVSSKKIKNYYLFNPEEEDEKRYKLILTQRDKDTFIELIEGREPPKDYSKQIVDNFNFFLEKIKNSKASIDEIEQGIRKLMIVGISLDRTADNPQLIFESLNSTGLELSQADLIRNFVLMGSNKKDQKIIYEKYWNKMEDEFSRNEGMTYFDDFMRDYLTIKTHEIPNEKKVYSVFKEFFRKEDKSVEGIVKDIHHYSKFYINLAFEDIDDKEILEKIQDINELKVDVAYPFLLQIFSDFENKIITREDLLEILDLVESYVFRRQICEIPTNYLNKTFAGLYNLIDKENYLESLKVRLILKEANRRYPNDSDFLELIQLKDIYNFRNKKYLYRKLEKFGRKEFANVDGYTIEHIMPQNDNVPQVWREELGENWREVHEKYLHRLGNLTWTGYNSELSDKSFKEKQTMEGGFKESPIYLNTYFKTIEKWNEEELEKRSKKLAEDAIKIWKYPEIQSEILQKYQPEKIEDDESDSSNRAKLSWATRRYLNPEKWGMPTEEDMKLLEEKNARLGASTEIDTIVCASSDKDSFERVFLNECHWHKIRIGEYMKEQLKYLAMYESAPISQIRYVGEIKEIKPFENSEYSEIFLTGKPIKIEPISLPENNHSIAPQSHKYTSKSRIDKAKTLEDIFLK